MHLSSNKYHAKKTVVDGITFDSKKEAQRYMHLRMMERAGIICGLTRQVKYDLIPAQYIDGKCVERAVNYYADFEYTISDKTSKMVGRKVTEDVKGIRTDAYRLKRKLMLYMHGIRITEI